MKIKPIQKLSIISPVYQGEALVEKLVSKLCMELDGLGLVYEIILVEDGSADGSWAKIQEACAGNEAIKGIKMRQNVGQHPAVKAGLESASGDWLVVMDCDLQDEPGEIKRLLAKTSEGWDLVLAQRWERKSSRFDKITSKAFYGLLSAMSTSRYDASVANFGIYSDRAIKDILSRWQKGSLFCVLTQTSKLPKSFLRVAHQERWEGKSSYSWMKRVELAAKHLFPTLFLSQAKEMYAIERTINFGKQVVH